MKRDTGFIMLLTVLVAAGIATLASVTLLLMNVSTVQTIQSTDASLYVRNITDGCIETALVEIKENDFTGNNTVTIDGVTCSYTVLDNGGGSREIQASTTSRSHTIRSRALISQRDPILITEWKEVASF